MKQPLIFKGDTEYAYASGVIRGLENYLLTRADYQKVFDAESNQIGAVLTELGYGGGEHNPEHALDIAIERTFATMDSLTKDNQFTDLWRMQYDIRNVQSFLKAHFFGEEIPPLLQFGTISAENLIHNIELALNNEKNDLPELFIECIAEAKRLYNSFHSPVAIDIALDRKFIGYIHEVLFESEYFDRWFAIYADWVNVKSFVRITRSKLPIKLFGEGFISNGDIPEEKFAQAMELDIENIPGIFLLTEYGRKLVEVIKKAFAKELEPLDIFFRTQLIMHYRYTKFCLFGPELLWAFAGTKLEEIGSLRTILRAKSAELPFDSIKEVISVVME